MLNHSNTNMCSSFDVVEQTITSNGRYINDTNIDIINVEIPPIDDETIKEICK